MNHYWLIPLCLLVTLAPATSTAQIIPDSTVGTTVTPNVNLNGLLIDTIDGGAQNGSNLFHSFSEFNINTNQKVYFTNPTDITNIFTRVTGSNLSSINGILGVLGNANLFLMNPNGIVFGNGATLDLKGSFSGTTASSINFADGSVFSSRDAINCVFTGVSTPLLTHSIPVGLGFGSQVGDIINRSSQGLFVPPNQTLALIGGNIFIEGGIISSRIELASLAPNMSANLSFSNQGLVFNYKDGTSYQDIRLINAAQIKANGDIKFQARQVSITDGSVVQTSSTNTETGGDITIEAEHVSLDKKSSVYTITEGTDGGGNLTVRAKRVDLNASDLYTEGTDTGKPGDVKLNVGHLQVLNGSNIGAYTGGASESGNVFVQAEQLDVIGTKKNSYTTIETTSYSDTPGKGGDIIIEAGKINLFDGGRLQAGTLSARDSGKLIVRAEEIYARHGGFDQTGIKSRVERGAAGRGMPITIEAKRITIQDGAQIATATRSDLSDAGDITIQASELTVLGGANINDYSQGGIFTTTTSARQGGDLILTVGNLQLINGGKITTGSTRSGQAGNLTVNANQVEIIGTDASNFLTTLSTSASGVGNAGNLDITANDILLSNTGSIRADVNAGNQGNIRINTNNLLMRRGSSISTNANSTANGGNINIEADSIVQLENSDITANAIKGKGGNIDISTHGLFASFDSNITASSELGINGLVNISTPDIKQQNNLVEQSSKFVNIEQAVATSCLTSQNTQQGKFFVTGNGGIPETPSNNAMSYSVVQVHGINIPNNANKTHSTSKSNWSIGEQIQEATQLVKTPDGRLLLATKTNTILPSAQTLTCSNS